MKHGPPQFQYVHPPPPEPLVMDDLKQVGKQMGTNTGGVYEDKSGKRFYIKKGQTKEHVKNEMIAANLAWRAGAKVLKYRKVKGGNHIATEMVKLTKNRASQLTPEEIRMTHDDFMVHAWLGNYDSIGTGGDNVGIPEGHHHPLALDLGGALEFRPRGKPKGDRFGADVQEFDAMRHGHDLPDPYPDAAAIYSSMTRADIRHSAWKVLDMKDKEIKEIVNKWGGKKELAAKLIARREDIKNKLKSLGAEGDPHSPKGIVVFPVGEDHAVKELNGIPFQEWLPPGDWSTVGGQNHNIDEPEFTEPPAPEPAPYDPKTKHDFVPGDVGLPYGSDLDDFVPFAFPGTKASDVIALPYVPKGKERASGLVIHEPDGRFWLVRPRNGFGGYEHTFPKGRLDKDLNPQANAIKEAWEESGIKAKIVGFIGDFEGSMTKTRYYLAERESGDPTVHQNESDGVLLVPPARLKEFLNAKRDNDIVTSIMGEGVILSFRDFLKGN
jgi:8-oxo-dGTP pyrophosphatase MutT (NUDIX family)